MTEKDLGGALMAGEHPIDVVALTHGVLRRDRRRIWMLGSVCIVAWMLVVMLPWATIMPMLGKVVKHQTELNSIAVPADATTMQQREQSLRVLEVVEQGTIATFIGSLASMFVAAICTVSLVVLSRRATLRQVNVRLGEISDQLKLLASKSV